MPALFDYASELTGVVPDLSVVEGMKFVQRAWRDIRGSRRWSFLVTDGLLVAPAILTTGSVTTANQSATVTGDGAASASWAAANVPLLTTRQFRVAGGPVYNIAAYDGVSTITLDRPWQEASLTGSGLLYQLYRCYFAPPTPDFLMWMSCFDPIQQYRFRRQNLYRTRAEVDRRDPGRTSFTNPIWIANYKADASGNPLFEMWPHPTVPTGYMVQYHRRGGDLLPVDQLPTAVPEDLLMERARYYTYQWANANQGRFPALKGPNWLASMTASAGEYRKSLQKAKVDDDNVFLQSYSPDESDSQLNGPIDANWLQSHDTTFV